MSSKTLDFNAQESLFENQSLFETALNNIYHRRGGEGTFTFEPSLYKASSEPLQKGINETFGKLGVEWGKQNEGFINQFKENTNIFAAFKSHEQAEQLSKLMIKEDGTLRSFYEFKKEAQKIIGDYNVRYLQTEYDTVVRSARAAANWKKFEENADLFPNIEFMESISNHKREEHLHFVGTILPIEHPFWNTHTPPLSWGCQCWLQATKKEATGLTEKEEDEPLNPVFENNPGTSGEPFVIEETSYAESAEKQGITKEQAKEFVQQQEQLIKERLLEYERLKADSNYIDVLFDEKTGGIMAIHKNHLIKNEAKDEIFFGGLTASDLEIKCQKILYKNGYSCILENEMALGLDGLILTALDTTTNGKPMDIKACTKNVEDYSNMLKKKNNQIKRFNKRTDIAVKADGLIIYFHDPEMYEYDKITKGMEYLRENLEIKQVIAVVSDGRVVIWE